ncbi:MAG: hypothetical protein HY916_09110 [Desulfovibrio sp.]|jgi:hypothetical protein|nr:hypothetical protein [Desulfovibrio sp.]
MYAIIVDGKVAEVTPALPLVGAMFLECGAEVRPGWIVVGGVCVAPMVAPEADPNTEIDAQIAALEATQHRATRELLLTLGANLPAEARVRLAEIDSQIEALRAQRV